MSKASPKHSLFFLCAKEDYLYNLEYDNKKLSLIYMVTLKSVRYLCWLMIGNYSLRYHLECVNIGKNRNNKQL